MGTLVSENSGTIPNGAVPLSALASTGGRGGGGSASFLDGGFTVTQFAPIAAPPTAAGTGTFLGGSPTGPVSVGGGSTDRLGRPLPSLGLSGPVGSTGGGSTDPSGPGGTSGIVQAVGTLAENLPRFNWSHVLIGLLILAGLYFLFPRISKASGKALKGARG